MTKQTEALKMAIEALIYHTEQTRPIEDTDKAIQACKEALEPTVAELNDEYLRDTHVEGLSTNSKANEIIKTQHWLCLDGQMVVAQLYTAPPSREWVGLSDGERKHLWKDYDISVYEFARAIEDKLRKKNNA
jgi:hypothetical protein